MAIINNSQSPPNDAGASSFITGAMVVIGLFMLFFYVGIPAIRRANPSQPIAPLTQVVIPDKVDVNITQK